MQSTGGSTQNERILAILKTGRRITALDALDDVGSMRLGARCYDLRKAGYDVRSEPYELPNGKRVARYWLELPKGQLSLFQMKTLGGVNQPSV